MQVWFWDESGFSLRVIRRKNWGKRGRRKNLTGQRRRGRVNVMGEIRVVFRSSVFLCLLQPHNRAIMSLDLRDGFRLTLCLPLTAVK